MLRAAAAGASGAAAYTAYHEARLSGEAGEGPGGALALLASAVLGAARRLLLALAGVPSAASSSPSIATSSPELVQRLQRQVDDLHQVLIRTLKERAQGGATTTTTTTTPNNRRQLAALAAATLATVAAVRAAKGLPPLPSFLPDLMYATRGSVKQLRQQLETSASSLREQMRLAARDLASRVGLVQQKQDALLAAQQELERALARVEGGVGLVRGDVAALAQRVEYGNRAVTLLCGVVGEVARAVGLPAPGGSGVGGAAAAQGLPPQQSASGNGRFSRMLEGLVMLEKHQQQHQQQQQAAGSSSDANTTTNQLLLPGEAPRRDAAAHLFRATEPAFMASRAPNPATYCDLLLTGGGSRPQQQQDGRATKSGGGPSRVRPATGLGALSAGGADWGDAAAVDASWGGAPSSSLRSWADDASMAADDVFSYGKKAAAPSAPPMPPPMMRGGF